MPSVLAYEDDLPDDEPPDDESSDGEADYRDAPSRAAHEAAGGSEAALDALADFLDHSPAVFYLKDTSGRYLMVNQQFLDVFGLTRAQVVDRVEEQVHPLEVAAAIRANDRRILAGGEPVRVDETVQHVDGPHEYLSVKVPLRDAAGRIWGLGGVSTDVTDRNRAIRELRDLNRRTELILNSLQEGVYGLDLGGKVTFVNPAAAAMVGWNAEDLHGLHQHDVLHHTRADGRPYPREDCPIYAVLRDGEPEEREDEVFWRRDGTSFPVAWRADPLRSGEQVVGAVVTFRDLTHERERERGRRELFAAREVQQRLYPKQAPHLPGFDIAAAVVPAEEACGDYCDFVPLPDGTLGVAVGDVSGHGLGAGLVMVGTRAFLRAGLSADRSPAEALNALETQIAGDLAEETFITLLLGRLDPRTGRFDYAAAGYVGWHLPASGPPRRLDSTGPPVGAVPEIPVEPGVPVDLAPGDLLLLGTDGLEEAMSPAGECFGWDRILAVVAERQREPAEAIVQAVLAACRRFTGRDPQRDDVTAVVIRALEPGGETAGG